MKFLKQINSIFIVLGLYFLVRLLLINTNFTEWGDTFRMIRGADYLSNFTWPWDEKRWPFYSLLLVPGIQINNPILWGRILAIFISTLTLFYSYLFYLKFSHDIEKKNTLVFKIREIFGNAMNVEKKYAILSVVLIATSSVFAYWSIRVMADPLFALLILVYTYYFIAEFQIDTQNFSKTKMGLSFLLLVLTMTRLEGIFMLFGTCFYFLITKKPRLLVYFLIPQILVYFPWTIYSKVLYKGSVENDYLTEASGFVFNFQRLKYFFTYTAFILVMPVFSYFVFYGTKTIKEKLKLVDSKIKLAYIPLVLFIAQELAIGFIWTPSLPRIYVPIISFAIILAVYGFKNFEWQKKQNLRVSFLTINLVLLGLFVLLQMQQKLYFLGASKILFALIVSINFIMIFGVYGLFIKSKKTIALWLIAMNILISSVIIYNQKDIYKTVVLASNHVLSKNAKAAYSDETGILSWYLKDNSYYLATDKNIQEPGIQYYLLKDNDVDYLIWTNEFNRGSIFIDPKNDDRYLLEGVYTTNVDDLLEVIIKKLDIMEFDTPPIFITKVYKVL